MSASLHLSPTVPHAFPDRRLRGQPLLVPTPRPVDALLLRAIAFAAVTAGAPVGAQPVTNDLAAVQLRLDRGDAAGAFAALAPQEAARAGEVEFDTLLGLAALDSGQIGRAIFALERAVATEPGRGASREALARAYRLAGDRDLADPFDGTPSLKPRRTAPAFSAFIETGVGRDSNVNSATDAGAFAIPAFGGGFFELEPDSRPRAAAFGSLALGGSATAPLSPSWSVVARGYGRQIANANASQSSSGMVDAQLGVQYAAGANTVGLALQDTRLWFGGDRYRTSQGLSGYWLRAVTPTTQISAYGQWAAQRYVGQPARDATRDVIGAGLAHQVMEGAGLLYGSVYALRERPDRAGTEFFDHSGGGARAGGEMQTGPVRIFAALGAERRNYRVVDPFFLVHRRDRQADGLIGLHWVPAPGWRVTTQWLAIRARSSVVAYDYRRSVLQVLLRREF